MWNDGEGPPSRTRSSLKRKQQISIQSKPKQRRKEFKELEELNEISLTLQPQLDKEKAVHSANTVSGQPSGLLSTPFVPERQTFELILDVLQRRDTYEIFAEPVDSDEVEDYYDIITEPMDFGTMRAKLHEGMYKTLEQFEHDVLLISGNAMHFNSSTTIFFRQARAINELSKKIFHVLRNDPGNFVSEFSGTRRRSSRRPQHESKDLNYKSCAKISQPEKRGRGGASSSVYKRNIRGGIKDDDAFWDSSDIINRRATYQTPSNSNNLEPLVLMDEKGLGYGESLMRFVKDLGPAAQAIAKRKLNGISANNTTNYRAETPLSAFTSSQSKPSTQHIILTNSSQNLRDRFPWSQTIRERATDIINSTNADVDQEKHCFTRAKVSSGYVLNPWKLADKENTDSSNAITLALPATSRRKNNSAPSSLLAQANGIPSLNQTSGSMESPYSALLNQTARTYQYLEPNRTVTSAPRVGFEFPVLLSQMKYYDHNNTRQPTSYSGFNFKNYQSNQVESNSDSYFNGQPCLTSFDIPDTNLALHL